MRHYKKTWPFYKTHNFNWTTKHYKEEKNITITGTPKNISQAKYVGELLDNLYEQNKLENTALVLGDESLLLPVLHSIPKKVKSEKYHYGVATTSNPAGLFL